MKLQYYKENLAKIEPFIIKNIVVMTSERNTYSIKIGLNNRLEYDETIDGDTIEQFIYCKICNRKLPCEFDIDEIIEHLIKYHNF